MTSSKTVLSTSTSRGSVMTAAASTQKILSTSTLKQDTTVVQMTTVLYTQTISATTSINTASVTETATKKTVPSPAVGKGTFLPGYDIHTDYTQTMPEGQLVRILFHNDLNSIDNISGTLNCTSTILLSSHLTGFPEQHSFSIVSFQVQQSL